MAERARNAKTFAKGDHVAWDTSQGETTGRVVEKVTGTAKVKGHTAKASKEHPEYRVRSDKSGAEAIHRPEELRKRD
jgi:Hypervirulence associated proteins TUDOR domain